MRQLLLAAESNKRRAATAMNERSRCAVTIASRVMMRRRRLTHMSHIHLTRLQPSALHSHVEDDASPATEAAQPAGDC